MLEVTVRSPQGMDAGRNAGLLLQDQLAQRAEHSPGAPEVGIERLTVDLGDLDSLSESHAKLIVDAVMVRLVRLIEEI
jgi:hypothetical protein